MLLEITILIFVVLIFAYLIFKGKEHMKGIPNINFDSGIGTTRTALTFTQPGMIGPAGTGPNVGPRELMNKLYDHMPYVPGEYAQGKYDYGNMFSIPNSYSDISDTTEDNLFRYTMERSRFSDNVKTY